MRAAIKNQGKITSCKTQKQQELTSSSRIYPVLGAQSRGRTCEHNLSPEIQLMKTLKLLYLTSGSTQKCQPKRHNLKS